MEIVEEVEGVRTLNDELEFVSGDDTEVSAEFFILCEENEDVELSKPIYDLKICGMSVLNWVVRSCKSQPKILKVEQDCDVLSVIKPYIDTDFEYSVVLFASTPLLNRTHLNDLLGFVSRKNMYACKLRKGFVFNNNYIKENDEIYSVDTYDFASNDFFEIKNYEDLAFAKEVLSKKVLAYHKKNGVYFENEKNLSVDANSEIGYATEISSGDIISNATKIGSHCAIAKNVTISGSKIGDDVSVGIGSIVVDSIIKDGTVIGDGVVIKNSVVGNNLKIGFTSKIIESSLRDEATIKDNVVIDNSRIGENCLIEKHTRILGLSTKCVVEKNSEIKANCLIVDSILEQNSIIDACSEIKNRVDK